MMNKNYPSRKTIKYVDPERIKKAAWIHALIGSFILVFSGVILYSLPAGVFYIAFIAGSYFFFSGIFIVFSIVSDRTARRWAKFLLAFWILKPKQ